MRFKIQKARIVTDRFLPILLILSVVFTSLISMCLVNHVSAATGGPTSSGELIYLNTEKNTAWAPTTSSTTYAVFRDSSGNVLGGASSPYKFAAVSGVSNLYSVAAPAGAVKIDVIVADNTTVLPTSLAASGKKRIFFNNSTDKLTTPTVYCWDSSANSDAAYPGLAMTQISGTNYWYYDTNKDFAIFNDGSSGTVIGTNKTADLTIPSVKDSVFLNLSSQSWDSAPYYKKHVEVDITSRASGANELYAMRDDSCVFSKYKYPDRNNYTSATAYIYNPDWSNAYVKFDMDDPYTTTVKATPIADKPGFFSVQVPADASFVFKPNQSDDYGASDKTYMPTAFSQPCFRMKNGANVWCELADAEHGYADYYAYNNFGSGILGVDATYFDYLSDQELSSGWLNPIQAGTGFRGSSDNWYPFGTFNSKINSVAKENPNWKFPLFFGNYCNTDGAYSTSTHGGPYADEVGKLFKFDYVANNSNGLIPSGSTVDFNYSVKGLAQDSLDKDGDIQAADGLKMPYFNSDWLEDQGIAKIVKSYFPFRVTQNGDTKTFSFNSQNATDNVYFDWENGKPVSVKYGSGTSYGVKDGIDYFMNPSTGQSSGYGIFPFNNAQTDSGRGGNTNLDYGFGIRMDMDFSISDSSAATFTYSGDDDLWIYYSEYNDDGTTGDSHLVLDLGGNHKMSQGSIDFKNGKSVANKSVGIDSSKFASDRIYITDSYSWGSGMKVWAWDSSGSGEWYDVSSDSGKYYVSASQKGSSGNLLSSKSKFKVAKDTSWSAQTDKEDALAAHYGRNTYTDNLAYTDGVTYNYNTNYTTNFTPLQSNKLYHMTIFYMERGMIESNAMMEFSMTPAQNDLKINKTIDTADINPGLEKAVQQLESFSFSPKENGSAVSGKYYTLNDETTSRICNTSFDLKDSQTADFNNQFKTGSKIQIVENEETSGIKYDTAWEVIDNKNASLISKGDGKSTDSFDLLNTKNKDDFASLQANFRNTPKTADVDLSKVVRNETDTADIEKSDVPFTYQITVDVNGGSDYRAYPLQYSINGTVLNTTDQGILTFSSKDKVKLLNMPVGVSLKIQEKQKAGYAPLRAKVNGQGYSSATFTTDGTVTSVVIEGTNSVEYVNIERPSTGVVRAVKTIDTKNYTGTKFSFTLSGLAKMGFWDGDEYKYTEDIGDQSKTVNSASAGAVEFRNNGTESILKFNHAGVYRYKLVEEALADTDANKADITTDSTTYLVEIRVTEGSGENLVVGSPTYYIPEQGKTSWTAVDFHSEYKIDSAPVFANLTKKGSVTIKKADQAGEKLSGTKFGIYKTTGKDAPLGDLYMQTFTDSDGVAKFSDIQIFKDGYDTSGKFEYQWYCAAELEPSTGYAINETKQYFQLPLDGDYDLTYKYVNGKIVNPETSGFGMNGFMVAGLCVIGFAGLISLGYYILRKRKSKGGHFCS